MICNVKLFDQDDGEVSYCQLPKGHKREHTPWPDLRINKPVPIPTRTPQADKTNETKGDEVIEPIETCTPEEIRMREAFFGWKERGFSSAWASLVAVKRADNKALLEALQAVVNGNDLAHSRKQTLESWPNSAFRKQARAAIEQAERQ